MEPASIECETFDKLTAFIQSPEFLSKLNESIHTTPAPPLAAHVLTFSAEPTSSTSIETSPCDPHQQPSPASSSTAEQDVEDSEYVLIDRSSAIEAMAFFIAEALSKDPAASSLNPKQLQDAISVACQGMKASRFKEAMKAGVQVYRFSAIAYSCFTCYTNPWIYQAILKCILQFSRLMIFGVGGQFGPVL